MKTRQLTIPMFPLNVVLFPGLVVPLGIGRERSRAAAQEAVRLHVGSTASKPFSARRLARRTR